MKAYNQLSVLMVLSVYYLASREHKEWSFCVGEVKNPQLFTHRSTWCEGAGSPDYGQRRPAQRTSTQIDENRGRKNSFVSDADKRDHRLKLIEEKADEAYGSGPGKDCHTQ
jgi:hypothetical protein